jgi:hypothetical protein
LEDNIEEEISTKNMNHGQLKKNKNPSMSALEHLMEKKEEQVGEALKARFVWELRLRHLGFWI